MATLTCPATFWGDLDCICKGAYTPTNYHAHAQQDGQCIETRDVESNPQTARKFPTGATRSDDSAKPNYIGYLSPLVIERFGRYMLEHQYGGQRSADNWKKGITRQAYIESAFRHFMDLWLAHEYNEVGPAEQNALCGLLFNFQGYLHELLREKK